MLQYVTNAPEGPLHLEDDHPVITLTLEKAI